MKTTDTEILRQFQTVLNRRRLSAEVYASLLKAWGLEGVDLDAEQQRINEKRSSLSVSRRKAVPEFIRLRALLDEMREDEVSAISFTGDTPVPLYSDTLIGG